MAVYDLGSFKKAAPVVSDQMKFDFLCALNRFKDGSADLDYLRRLVFTDEAIDSGNFQKWSPRDHTGRCSCDFEPYRPLIERFAPGSMPPLPEAPVTSLADVRRTRSDGPVQKI